MELAFDDDVRSAERPGAPSPFVLERAPPVRRSSYSRFRLLCVSSTYSLGNADCESTTRGGLADDDGLVAATKRISDAVHHSRTGDAKPIGDDSGDETGRHRRHVRFHQRPPFRSPDTGSAFRSYDIVIASKSLSRFCRLVAGERVEFLVRGIERRCGGWMHYIRRTERSVTGRLGGPSTDVGQHTAAVSAGARTSRAVRREGVHVSSDRQHGTAYACFTATVLRRRHVGALHSSDV